LSGQLSGWLKKWKVELVVENALIECPFKGAENQRQRGDSENTGIEYKKEKHSKREILRGKETEKRYRKRA